MDCSLSGFPFHGIFQARVLEWGAIAFSSQLLLLLSRFSRVRLCVTPEMAAHQAPLSLGFSRQEHWSGVSLPSLLVCVPGVKYAVPASKWRVLTTESPGQSHLCVSVTPILGPHLVLNGYFLNVDGHKLHELFFKTLLSGILCSHLQRRTLSLDRA